MCSWMPKGNRRFGSQTNGALEGNNAKSYLVGIRNVDRLSMLPDIANDAFAPGDLHLI